MARLKLEARSLQDCGWYDSEVIIRDEKLFVRFDGYPTEDEERLESLDRLRFSSHPAENKHCGVLVAGTQVTGFKRKEEPEEEIWVDAQVVAKAPGAHRPGEACNCRFTVRWLDTTEQGSEAVVPLEDLCLLDPRPLSAHPQFHAFQSVLRLRQRQAGTAPPAGLLPDSGRVQQVADTPPESPVQGPAAAAEPLSPSPNSGQPAGEELRPPSWARGPPCMLCQLPTAPPAAEGKGQQGSSSSSSAQQFEGIQLWDWGCVHRRCASWSVQPALKAAGANPSTHIKRVNQALKTALNEAMLGSCRHCSSAGATVQCAQSSCKMAFHLHCTAKCKLDWESLKLLCPAHSVLGSVKPVPGAQFYITAKQQEGGRKGGRNTTITKMMERRKRPLALQPVQGGQAQAGGKRKKGGTAGEALRRSGRQGKRVRYAEGPLAADDTGSDFEGEEEDGSSTEDEGRLQYADESEGEGDFQEQGRGRRGGKQQRRGRQRDDAKRKSERSRRQVRTYDEQAAERELYEEALKEEARRQQRGSGYEDTHCQICHSKARAKEMLLCDGCDEGWHMGCLTPPLGREPLALWFCPGCIKQQECEACGKKPGAGKKKGPAAAATATLDYCPGCGAVCHPGCMQETEGGAGVALCAYCVAGLTAVDAVLGCRTVRGRLEYYVKFKDASYRRCQWVREATALRMCFDRVQRFRRETRDAASVEPNVQPQWLEVERVISVRPAPSGGAQCLVKWRGLAYGRATWEPQEEVEPEALRQYERRMALRVERDEGAEAAARAKAVPRLPAAGPSWLQGVGSLKHYQVTGVDWLLSKLHAGLSVILGDEMGLGKTIQTAVFLQQARAAGLTTGPVCVVVPLSTIGSWERELAKWAPGLEVLAYNGDQEARGVIRKYELGAEEEGLEAARQKQAALLPRFHVMLTTYEVADKDAAALRRFGWSGIVIDEGHRLKGEASKLGAQLRSLGAPWRLLLTGTPLQNNLRELFALLAFMADSTIEAVERRIKALPDPNPPPPPSQRRPTPAKPAANSMLASPSKAPDEPDPETLEAQSYVRRLHAYLEPRMLRRLKHTTLLGELPAKITRKVACRLSPMQRQLYADILARNYEAVNATAQNRAARKSMNNILMRLRQACNHPYLFAGQEPEDLSAEEAQRLLAATSGKLSVLQQMLPRLLAGGHRILIFSQSTELLDILEDFLHGFQDTTGLLQPADQSPSSSSGEEAEQEEEDEEEGGSGSEEEGEAKRAGAVIPFYRIDGSTKLQDRQAMIDAFNHAHCKVKVFLMSTRAGSLGINLQSADTIILYDPDFNPFVDAQAEGRAHRLGQQKTVLVYQMYTAHSVEERILALAAKKRRLEEVVTKHLGREKEVSDDDLKSSLFYGWGNLMRSAGEDGRGEDVGLSEADLAKLLDRSRVQEGDLVIGADAASLLGEVKEGNAAAMTFEQQDSEEEAEDAVVDRAAEQHMWSLLEQRAAKFRQEQQEAEERDLGRGRRAAQRAAANYAEESGGESDEEGESPGLRERRRQAEEAKAARRHGKGGRGSEDDDYNPLFSPSVAHHRAAGQRAGPDENDQPNNMHPRAAGPLQLPSGDSSSSDSESDSGSDSGAAGRSDGGGGGLVQTRLVAGVELSLQELAAAIMRFTQCSREIALALAREEFAKRNRAGAGGAAARAASSSPSSSSPSSSSD